MSQWFYENYKGYQVCHWLDSKDYFVTKGSDLDNKIKTGLSSTQECKNFIDSKINIESNEVVGKMYVEKLNMVCQKLPKPLDVSKMTKEEKAEHRLYLERLRDGYHDKVPHHNFKSVLIDELWTGPLMNKVDNYDNMLKAGKEFKEELELSDEDVIKLIR